MVSQLALASALFSIAVPALAATDPCTTAGSTKWVDVKVAHACELAVPYDQARSASLVDNLIKFLAFLSPQSYQLNSPNPRLPLKADVAGSLNAVKAKVAGAGYPNDWSLNIDIAEAFNQLKDGHSIFSPTCAAAFSWNLPISVASLAQTPTGLPDIYAFANYDFPNDFNTTGFEAYYLAKGIDVRKVDGAKVLTIDGQDAKTYLSNLAITSSIKTAGVFGSYLDANTRFNRLVTRFSADTASGDYALERGRFAQRSLYPAQESVAFTFQTKTGTVKLNIPFVATTNSKFTDTASYTSTNCLAAASLLPEIKARPHPVAVVREDVGAPPADSAPGFASTNSVRPTTPSLYHVPGGFDIYQLPNHPQVGVLYLQQFEGAEDFTPYVQSYIDGLYTGLSALKSKGVKHLIIETSGNRGGYIYAGAITLWSLFPKDNAPGYANQYRDGPLPEAISLLAADPANQDTAFSSNYFYGWYRDLKTNQLLQNDTQFLSPPVKKTVNGVPDRFSQWVYDDFGDSSAGVTNFTTNPFDGKDIIIISNSICASTCSVVSSHLYEKWGVRTASFEGLPSSRSAQFDGGVKGTQVIAYTDVQFELSLWPQLNNRTDLPAPLPIKASMTANFRNGLSLKEPQYGILEFVDYEADNHYQYTLDNWKTPQAVWEDVAERTWGRY